MFIKYYVYKDINTENVTNVTIVNTYNVCTYALLRNTTGKNVTNVTRLQMLQKKFVYSEYLCID